MPDPSREVEPQQEKVAILVVDDRPENILAMRSILSRPDYEVIGVPSGSDALKPLLKYDFAVILLDVLMPGLDGFETAKLIRQREASRHIPIIFLTAAGNDMSMIQRGYSSGAVDYLLKPIDAEIVKAKVSVFVDLYRKTQQLKRQEEKLRESERMKSELALRESEAEFAATFEQAPSGIAHAATDGRWLRVNTRFAAIIGKKPEEILGKRFQDLVPPDEVQEIAGALRRVVERGETIHWSERRVQRFDGGYTWVSASLSLLREASGKPKKIIVVAEDISDRKRAEEEKRVLAEASKALLRSLEYSQTLIEAARLTLGSMADEAAVAICNEVKGCADPAILHVTPNGNGKNVPERLKQVLIAVLSEGTARIERFEDAPRSILVAPMIMRGQLLGAIGLSASEANRFGPREQAFAEDLAVRGAFAIENARLYLEAQQAITARDEFLSIASHELRTPLTPLLLQLQSLSRPPVTGGAPPINDPAQVTRVVQRAEKQVNRLTALVENLLDVSRISSGQLKLQPTEVDLSELTRDVVSRFAEQIARSGSSVDLQTGAPILGSWDRLRIEQVVTNLVANAIKYGSGKPIVVRVEPLENVARLMVRDQGIGIPLDKRHTIFQRFGRAVSVRSFGGLGLGLYITRQILDAHGGSIEVDSQPGEGSTFTVLLPRRVETNP